MVTYFLDSSAIIKRYIFEPGQAWILSLCHPAQGHDLYISQAALVEVVAAICRRAREKSISIAEHDRLITVFRQDSKQGYNILPVTTDLYHAASDLCRLHRLRAYDAVQLACVLALRQYTLANQAPESIFVYADVGLLDTRDVEGLKGVNPNN